MNIFYLSAYGIINILLLLFAMYIRKSFKNTFNRTFLCTIWLCLFASIMDIICVYFEKNVPVEDVSISVRMLFSSLYLLLQCLSPVAFMIYIIALTNSFHKIETVKIYSALFLAPYAVVVLTIILNSFTLCMFEFSPEGEFIIKPLYFVTFASIIIYLIFGFIHVSRHRKELQKSKLISIYYIFIMIFCAVVCLIISRTSLIHIFIVSLALFINLYLVHRPEEFTDSNMGVYNYHGFMTFERNNFLAKQSTNLIFIRILNTNNITKLVEYTNFQALVKRNIEIINNYFFQNNIEGDIYYLNSGLMAISLKHRNRNYSWTMANYLLENLVKTYQINRMIIPISYAICHVKHSEDSQNTDVTSFNEMLELSKTFHTLVKDYSTVISLEDLKLKQRFEELAKIEEIIKDGLENNKFEMFYQPIYSIRENKIIAAEALIRLRKDSGGYIPPDEFIPAAEKNGSILQIGDFVLDSVCQFVGSSEFKRTGLRYIDVNLSVYQCMQPDLVDKVQYFVQKHNISVDQINLEITESFEEHGSTVMLKNICALSELGFKFSLDDYGTGYSNIKRIATLPLELIKFDKTFVNEAKNPQMEIVLKNSIGMIKEMNKKIVIEGIETSEMLSLFSSYNCDYIQGYYFSKPLPKNQFCEWLENWNNQK